MRGNVIEVHCCCIFVLLEIISTGNTVYMWALMIVKGFIFVGFKYMCRTGRKGMDRPDT